MLFNSPECRSLRVDEALAVLSRTCHMIKGKANATSLLAYVYVYLIIIHDAIPSRRFGIEHSHQFVIFSHYIIQYYDYGVFITFL